jgi:glucan biosynthesis protein C
MRLFFIDNLGILLISLVVVFHLSVTYGASGFWPYHENPQPDDLTALVFTLFTALNGPYVVGFFFLIAGHFTPSSYDRKGFGSFLRDRLIRLGIPFVFYILIFDPLIYYAIKSTASGHWGSFLGYLGNHFRGYQALGVGPLWFVEGLLIFTILYALWRLVARTTPSPSQHDAPPPSNVAIALFALGLGGVTFVVRLWLPVGSILKLLSLPLALFPQYAALFVVGILAYLRTSASPSPQLVYGDSRGDGQIVVLRCPVCQHLHRLLYPCPCSRLSGAGPEGHPSAPTSQVCFGFTRGRGSLFRNRLPAQEASACQKHPVRT